MKVGSLCKCENAAFGRQYDQSIAKLVKGKEYWIRWIRRNVDCGCNGVLTLIGLEGVYNDSCNGREMGYDIRRFCEIEFPPALEQEIKELISEPVELCPPAEPTTY